MQYCQMMLTNCTRRVQRTVMKKCSTMKMLTSATPLRFSK